MSISCPLKCESYFFSLDSYQFHLKIFLSIFNTPLNFHPNLTFLCVTFDQIFSFKHHVLSLRKKFRSQFRAFRSIASASTAILKNLPVHYPSFFSSFFLAFSFNQGLPQRMMFLHIVLFSMSFSLAPPPPYPPSLYPEIFSSASLFSSFPVAIFNFLPMEL